MKISFLRASSFRSLHSTVTALLETTDNWAFDIDRANVDAVLFLDLKRHLTLLIRQPRPQGFSLKKWLVF